MSRRVWRVTVEAIIVSDDDPSCADGDALLDWIARSDWHAKAERLTTSSERLEWISEGAWHDEEEGGES